MIIKHCKMPKVMKILQVYGETETQIKLNH